ncbi:MFS transporter [Mucisphaera calidilacus]|uniref:Major Facilitator Superfamily protein n=1 Tax=Mucisphaera calidilacus TaxID=2527982 RepID=A0A518BYJ3_9BACT|nr:MFS transporter [Mucisphaera calidilacus]QDU72041.1 Major Facilitator Superfamily protein [Mucisphaera calidilacus]
MTDSSTTLERAHQLLTAEDDGRACRDIPDEACREQPANFFTHVATLACTKTGDGLIDPKLVLSWLVNALGAPAGFVGLLVPVREAGSLLPQLVSSGWIRSMPQRKWAWAAGSLVQALAVMGIAAAAMLLRGAEAGIAITALLAVFALGRSVCSVSYKDVLGKTVSKATRGTATGTASTLAAAGVLTFGILLATGILPRTIPVIVAVLLLAATLWITAALLMARLHEEAGSTEGGRTPLSVVRENLTRLTTDRQLLIYILTRGLLTTTAIAPPYIVMLDQRDAGYSRLGWFVIASSLAALLSTYAWGRLADRSSRWVLILSALIAAAILASTATLAWIMPNASTLYLMLPFCLFALMIAYQGVRLGRSVHLVDMATPETRAAYTALSNTIIGALLLLTSGFGIIAQAYGTPAVLALFAILCALAAVSAFALKEVQSDD